MRSWVGLPGKQDLRQRKMLLATKEDIALFLVDYGIAPGFSMRRLLAEQPPTASLDAGENASAIRGPYGRAARGRVLGGRGVWTSARSALGVARRPAHHRGRRAGFPPAYSAEYQLVVNALIHAANLYQRGERREATTFVLVTAGLMLLTVLTANLMEVAPRRGSFVSTSRQGSPGVGLMHGTGVDGARIAHVRGVKWTLPTVSVECVGLASVSIHT